MTAPLKIIRRLPAALACAWALGSLAASVPEDAERVFAQVSPSVLTLRTLDEQGHPEGQGSGVVVGKGLVATSCHVIRDASAIRVEAGKARLAGRWLRQNAALDLCLLAVDELTAPPLRLRPGASLAIGEPVFAVGNPLGFGLAVSAGLIATAEQKEPHPFRVVTAPLSPGSSGGGLFDREGRLVGLTQAVLGSGQNLNMVLSADSVAAILTGGAPPPAEFHAPPPEKSWEAESDLLLQGAKWAERLAHAQAWTASQPASAVAATVLGASLLNVQRRAEAEASLRQALTLDPDYSPAWRLLADLLAVEGRQDEAEKALKESDKRFPFSAQAAYLRANWAHGQGRKGDARELMREAIRRAPDSSAMWRFVGQLEDELGHPAEAARAFAVALRLGDEDLAARQRLAELYAGAGKVDEASRLGESEQVPRRNNGRTQLQVGLGELRRGRLGPAEEALRKAVDLLPEAAESWTGLGTVLIRLGRFEEAESAYDKALQLAPGSASALANRGAARISLKRLPPALEDARAAIALAPAEAQAWRIAALAYLGLGQFQEAGMAFQKLADLIALSPGELVSWADALLGTGSVEEALKLLGRAEAADPKLLRMCLTMAKARGAKGDMEGALAYELRALAIDPVNGTAWSGKGFALLKLGRPAEAVEALETAVRLEPGLGNAWINLGEAELRRRNLGKAIQALEKALSLAPNSMDARYYLAQAYLGARLPQKARENAEKLLDKQPGFAPALGLVTMSHLLEGNGPAAAGPYQRLKASAPALAGALRQQALAAGLAAAANLPE